MKPATVAAIVLALTVTGIFAYRHKAGAPSMEQSLRDSPLDLGQDVKGLMQEVKRESSRDQSQEKIPGKAVRGTSAVSDIKIERSVGSIRLLDLERQSDRRDQWTYVVQGKLVSDRDPKGIPVTMYNTEIETHRPYDPNRRPENPITEFSAYFHIRRDGASFENVREDSPTDIPYRKLAAIAVNTSDTVRLIYKQEVVGKVEIKLYEALLDIVPNTTGHDEAPNGIWLDEHQPIDITLIDADMDLNPARRDQVLIRVYSGSDPKGIEVSLIETFENSANFAGQFRVTKRKTEPYALHVKPGDQVSAVYVDEGPAQPGKPTKMIDYVTVFRRGH